MCIFPANGQCYLVHYIIAGHCLPVAGIFDPIEGFRVEQVLWLVQEKQRAVDDAKRDYGSCKEVCGSLAQFRPSYRNCFAVGAQLQPCWLIDILQYRTTWVCLIPAVWRTHAMHTGRVDGAFTQQSTQDNLMRQVNLLCRLSWGLLQEIVPVHCKLLLHTC